MKTMREGLGRMWRENPLIVILLLIGTALCIWRVAAGRYDTLLQTTSCPVTCPMAAPPLPSASAPGARW